MILPTTALKVSETRYGRRDSRRLFVDSVSPIYSDRISRCSDLPPETIDDFLLLRVKICRDETLSESLSESRFRLFGGALEETPYEIPSQHNPAGLLALCMHHWLVMTLAGYLSLLKSRDPLFNPLNP